jgi:demethylmenaquinone methyltransferase / 2-methoxy-6-polyprenyl-1,4-benzoquinol methylase
MRRPAPELGAGSRAPGADPRVLFSQIAPRYDLLNRLMSLGMDGRWRRLAAEAAVLPPGTRALDVGAGTGELTRALLRRWPGCVMHALDSEPAMMRLARGKAVLAGVRWLLGDALSLPYPDASFDAVVSAFVLRNLPDRRQALAEQRRVTRPGGRVVCLEMTWPRAPLFRTLYRLYFAGIMPVLTGLLSGQPEAYRYLPRSVQAFPAPEDLSALMEAVGLEQITHRRMGLGTVALHVGFRAGSRGSWL